MPVPGINTCFHHDGRWQPSLSHLGATVAASHSQPVQDEVLIIEEEEEVVNFEPIANDDHTQQDPSLQTSMMETIAKLFENDQLEEEITVTEEGGVEERISHQVITNVFEETLTTVYQKIPQHHHLPHGQELSHQGPHPSDLSIKRLVNELHISKYLSSNQRSRNALEAKTFFERPALRFEWEEGPTVEEWIIQNYRPRAMEEDYKNWMEQRLRVAMAMRIMLKSRGCAHDSAHLMN